MKEIETNINMDTTKCQARSCDPSNITDQESQWNLEMFTPILKQETVHLDEEEIPQDMDDEETICNNCMSPCKPLLTSDCVDNSDCKFYVLEELKKEFPEDECPQPVGSISSKLVFENEELSQVIERQEFKQENSEESFSLIEIEDEEYPLMVKIESLEEHRVLDNFGNAGVHYDVLVTPQQVQCKFCSRTFKNRYSLLVHNNEHTKVVMNPTPVDVEMNQLHKCKFCDEYFNSHTHMLAHICDVHSNERHKSGSYNEGIKPYLSRKNGEKMEYKCDLCENLYKSKEALVKHTKRIHVDYGKMFECRCGEKFCTTHHLSQHKRRQHNPNVKIINNQQYQCDSCNNFFKTKRLLVVHIKRMHYDYGKTFECSCGKQFRTPIYLYLHNQRMHCAASNNMNEEQFPCDSCHKFFKTEKHLVRHIRSIHYDYGKTFECSCGKQFRTPRFLRRHEYLMHSTYNKNKFQCDPCGKFFKNKEYLARHIKHAHYDYGKMFICWCGKQFSKPTLLRRHERGQHNNTNIAALKAQFQCDICQKFFKAKKNLTDHKRNVHHDYGKTFECSCGKQFRTPLHLYQHNQRMHRAVSNNMNEEQFPCDSCHKFFKTEKHLASHIRSIHYDYGKTFECSCGKQFRTSSNLYQHNQRMHCGDGLNINNGGFQCHICQKLVKTKMYLTAHIKSAHYDYGKTFECWCGKQFRTPRFLRKHEYLIHSTYNNNKFQCDSCGKCFKNKRYLAKHIKNVHYDYGKIFSCWCGKQFSKPTLLRRHERGQHNNINIAALKAQFQCDICEKFFKAKKNLTDHIKNMHHDYGKVFVCVCGKQFRTPLRLRAHERYLHNNESKDTAGVNTNILM